LESVITGVITGNHRAARIRNTAAAARVGLLCEAACHEGSTAALEPDEHEATWPPVPYEGNSFVVACPRITAEEAIAYCEQNGLPYRVIEPSPPKRVVQDYADNFAYTRRVPWTH
jgi:hypothetical protein